MTRTEKTLFTAACLLLGLSVYLQIIAGRSGDKTWLLDMAHMWLGGKKLYVDIFQPNMPLITWIYALPVYVSMHVPTLADYQVLSVLGVGVVAFSIGICVKLIRWHPEFTGDRKKQVQFALLLGFVFIFCTNPSYFFDREQIFLVLAFPYILRFMPSLARAPLPPWLRIITGCMAGIGFCMKPHTLIVFLGLQLIYIVRERSLFILRSLENILIYVLGALYLLAVWWFTPEYITTVLPMALLTYAATGRRYGGIYYSSVALFIFGVTFADFRLRYTSPYRRDIFYLMAVCIPFLGYALINNGWGYTYNLLISVLLILTGWVLWEFLYLKRQYESRGLPQKQFLFGARACAVNLAVNGAIAAFLWMSVFMSNCDNDLNCSVSRALVAEIQNEHIHSFGTLSISFAQWSEMDRAGAKWDTRFSQLWMLPEFFGSDEAFARRHRWILQYVADAYAQDLEKNRPAIMFVDDDDLFYSVRKHVDLLAYFSSFPNFVQAWQHYHYIRTLNLCPEKKPDDGRVGTGCRYFVYKRTPDAPSAFPPKPPRS